MKKILIIDDDRDFCAETAALLGDEGYAVAAAHDGREGLALAARGGFALVILDLKLPGLGGIEILRCLRRGKPVPPVIVVSGSPSAAPLRPGAAAQGDPEERRLLRRAAAVVPKPFDVEKLLRAVRDLIG
jgi:DNA-binding response OmpR family regulator